MTDREWLKANGTPARLMSFALTARQFEDGSKTVTRRGGPLPAWQALKPGDLIEGVEWSPRVGCRYVCNACGSLGVTKYHGYVGLCGGSCPDSGRVVWRAPRRLGLAAITSVSEVRLGDITADEVAAEGFPGKSPQWFLEFYSKSSRPGLWGRQVADWRVTRIQFRRYDIVDDEMVPAEVRRQL